MIDMVLPVRGRGLLVAVAIGMVVAARAHAQGSPSTHIGLGGAGALGLHVGTDAIEHDSHGLELGGVLDLGWVRAPRFRLQAEVDFLRATLTEFVELDDKTYDGAFFDLTGSLSGLLMVGGPRWRIAPYLVTGAGVHALSSSFGTVTLDGRYNANPFGVHLGAGARWWLSSRGRTGLSVEVRRVMAANVERTSVRIGTLVFFGDLVRPR